MRFTNMIDGTEWVIKEDPEEKKLQKVEDLKWKMMYITSNFIEAMKNEKFRKQVINELKTIEKHIHRILEDVGEYATIEVEMKSKENEKYEEGNSKTFS